jgi:hypothetical protein
VPARSNRHSKRQMTHNRASVNVNANYHSIHETVSP